MIAPVRIVAGHFEPHRRRGKLQFSWRITVEGLLVPSGILFVIRTLFDIRPTSALGTMDFMPPRFGTVILSPVIETVLLQVLPVMIAVHFRGGHRIEALAATVAFAAARSPFESRPES